MTPFPVLRPALAALALALLSGCVQPVEPPKKPAPREVSDVEHYQTYVIRRGDTREMLNATMRGGIDGIMKANPDLPKEGPLPVGKVIRIPRYDDYAPKTGDTLASIARLFHLSPEDLVAENPGLTDENLLRRPSLTIPLYLTRK